MPSGFLDPVLCRKIKCAIASVEIMKGKTK